MEHVLVSGTVFVGSVLSFLTWQRWQGGAESGVLREEKKCPTSTLTDLHLLPREQQAVLKCPAACTITFYRGYISTDYLTVRLKDILISNPFLTSRLRKPSFFSKEVIATFDSNPEKWCLADYFDVVEDSSISREMPYQELMLRINKYRTKIGTKCTNRNEVVFKITLIRMQSDAYAIVVSLNHSIGDGHTFYKILGMLNQSTVPYALDPVRCQRFESDVENSLDADLLAKFKNPLAICGFLYNMCSPLLPHVCVVDKDYVDKAKSAYLEQAKVLPKAKNTAKNTALFISTNDIITSWFCNYCRCSFGAMVVNFRNRLQGLTDTMAGNYVRSAMFTAADMSRPEYLRESLHAEDPHTHTPFHVKGCSSGRSDDVVNHVNLVDILTLNVVAVTNWASFYEDVVLPGGTMELHLPVMTLTYIGARACLIIFKCNNRDTAVVLWGGSKMLSMSPTELAKETIFSRIL